MINGTIRYSGASNDLLGIVTYYFKEKTFLELSKTFSLTHASHNKSKESFLNILRKAHTNKTHTRYFDNLYTHQHITYTDNSDGSINITINPQMVSLILFIKDPECMDEYSEYFLYFGGNIKRLIDDLKIKEQFPESFV
jgi:hypothetical protein